MRSTIPSTSKSSSGTSSFHSDRNLSIESRSADFCSSVSIVTKRLCRKFFLTSSYSSYKFRCQDSCSRVDGGGETNVHRRAYAPASGRRARRGAPPQHGSWSQRIAAPESSDGSDRNDHGSPPAPAPPPDGGNRTPSIRERPCICSRGRCGPAPACPVSPHRRLRSCECPRRGGTR